MSGRPARGPSCGAQSTVPIEFGMPDPTLSDFLAESPLGV